MTTPLSNHTPDDRLSALMLEWRHVVLADGNRGVPHTELMGLCRSGINKLVAGAHVPPGTMTGWIEATCQLGLRIREYARQDTANGEYVLTEKGLIAAKIDAADLE